MSFKMDLPASCLLVGTTNTGKSHLLKCIMGLHANFFNYGVVFSPTSFNGGYDFINDEYVYEHYDENIIKNILDKQKQAIELAKEDPKLKIPECFIIIDDGIGLIETHNTKNIFNVLYATGRHYHISTFLCSQAPTFVNPAIRNNSMYVFITKIKPATHKTLFQMSTDFTSEQEFSEYLNRNCKDYRIIMFDDSDPYGETLKIIKAPKKIPDFYLDY